MIVLLALALVIVLPVALMTASAFLFCPRDPLLHAEKPWSCSRCEGEWPDLAAFFGHVCVPRSAMSVGVPVAGGTAPLQPTSEPVACRTSRRRVRDHGLSIAKKGAVNEQEQ